MIQALLELDCIPAGMELFPAADDDAWSLITRVIDDCDYYLLIVGNRYGSISAEGISYTEREYDYAVSAAKPVLAFIHAEPDLIPAGKSELDSAARARLEAFRVKVRQRLVRTFSTAHELGSAVSRSLVKTMRDRPGEGWVRGRHAMSAEVAAEISDLRARVAEQELELKQQEGRESADVPPAELAQGGDQIELHYTISGYNINSDTTSLMYTWNELIMLLGPSLLSEATDRDLVSAIEADILRREQDTVDYRISGANLKLDSKDFNVVKVQLRALRLVDKGTKKRAVADRGTYWMLTDLGDKQLVSLMAIKRTITPH